MGGEGSMAAANASLKNNRSQLSKRKERKALEGSYAYVELKDFPKATPEQIKEIKEKIIKQNKTHSVKLLVVFTIFVVVLILIFTYN